MKNTVGLKIISFILLFLGILGISTINIKGMEKVSNFNESKYKVNSIVEENILFGGIKHTKYSAESSYTRNTDDDYIGETIANKLYSQSVNTLEIPNNGKAKVVQWTYLPSSSTFGWSLTTVVKMAANYELHNPGYKVIAAINGDFFDIKSAGSYGPLLKTTRGVGVSDGEVIRAMDARGLENNPLTIGFKNNGKIDNYVQGGKIEFSENHILTLYDENENIIDELEIKYINTEPSDGEIAVYFSYPTGLNPENKAQGYELVEMPANNAYVCKNPYRLVPSSNINLYAKGSLTEATETKDLAWGTFGIVTTNQSIRQKIDSAKTVRVQRKVIGDYAECESIGGGVFPLLLNGQKFVDQDTDRHPRTMIGAKEDGTVVMVTVDGRQKASGMYGMTSDELGAVMQYYGCVSAVNLDGGGSTTIAIRDENNKFKIMNSPSDGSERNDANCYLVVMKQADFEISSTEVLPNSISFNIDTSETDFETITKIKCTLNGVTKEVVDNQVTFDGLESNKCYSYEFSYDTNSEKNIETLLAGEIYSSRQIPTFGPLDIKISSNKLIFTPSINDPDGALNYYRIFINDKREPYLDEPIVVSMNLEGLQEITFDVLISYDLNNGLGKIEKTEKYIYNILTGELKDPTEKPNNKTEKGCKKDLSIMIASFISLSSLLMILKKHKK